MNVSLLNIPRMDVPRMDVPEIEADSGALLCPNCGCNNLHHNGVRYFERGEDAPSVDVVEINDGRVLQYTTKSAYAANPSGRRGGMYITFVCEQCDGAKFLAIYQHKGTTFVEWVSK